MCFASYEQYKNKQFIQNISFTSQFKTKSKRNLVKI